MNTKTETTKFTRQDYLSDVCTHEQYHAQFITDETIAIVLSHFSKNKLQTALEKDKYLNSIPLYKWDGIANIIRPIIEPTMKKLGDFYSLAGGVCAAKAAARYIVTNL